MDYIKQDIYVKTEDHYVAAKSRIISFLSAIKTSDPTVEKEATIVLKRIQLPKINLPTFDSN